MQKLLLIIAIATAALFPIGASAVTYEVTGTINATKDSIILSINLGELDQDIDQTKVADYLEIYVNEFDLEKPIVRALGDLTEGRNKNFYWDPNNATSQKNLDSSNDPVLNYSNVTIKKNTGISDNDKSIEGLISSDGTIKVKIGFRPDPSDEDLSSIKQSDDFFIKRETAAVSEAPTLAAAQTGNGSISFGLTASSKVKYSDGETKDAPSVLVLLFAPAAEGSPGAINDAAMIADTSAASTGDSAAEAGICTYSKPSADGGNCISCSNALAYIDADSGKLNTIKGSGVNTPIAGFKTVSNSSKLITFNGLENGVTYTAVAQYLRGTARSTCYSGSPIEDTSLLESNSSLKASPGDARCFIATAAFGSPLHPYLDELRWFRDTFLKTTALGSRFVESYYLTSPKYAASLEGSPEWKPLVQAALLPLVAASWSLRKLTAQTEKFVPKPLAPAAALFIGLFALWSCLWLGFGFRFKSLVI